MNAVLLAALVSPACAAQPAPVPDAPVELGRVEFLRSVERGLERAGAEAKPVFLLFQEVPGCSTCRGFGRGPLSDPLLVEAIETLFVPVAVFNNAGGADARALERFGEPGWNNPVVRFLDARGADLIPRRDRVWTQGPLAQRMCAALAAAEAPVPAWLALADLDARRDELPRLALAMHCFWEGQAVLGGLAGVADARPGFLEGAEVVELRYDPERLPLAELLAAADRAGLARRAWVEGDAALTVARRALGERAAAWKVAPRAAAASDDLRALKRTPLAQLELPRAQAVRLNASLAARGERAPGTLSPRQERALQERARK